MRPRSIAPLRRWPRWPDTFWSRSSRTRNPGTEKSRLRAPALERPNGSGRRDRSDFHIRPIVGGSASFDRQLLAHRKPASRAAANERIVAVVDRDVDHGW